jgi:dienelactone hydrolase
MLHRASFGLALSLLACSSNPAAPPSMDASAADVTPADAVTGPSSVARFELPERGLPQPGQVPFPTDLYLGADGVVSELLDDWTRLGVGASASGQASLNEGYSALRGFGRNSGGLFVVDGDAVPSERIPGVSAASADAPYALIDIDARSPTRGQWVPAVAGYVPSARVLNVQPDGVVLAPGRRYAAVLTTRFVMRAGTLRVAPTFARLRDLAASARSTPAEQLYGAATDAVVAAGIARERIAAVAVFTTQSGHAELRAARDALVRNEFGAAPTLNTDPARAAPYGVARFGAAAHDGWTATLDAWMGTPLRDAMGRDVTGEPHSSEPATTGIPHDALGAVITGTFVAPEFRRPWTQSSSRNDGTIALDAMGRLTVFNREKTLPITLALPRSAPPPTGWPVVIYGHGLGGQRKHMFSVANELARAGIATVAIDTATFGQRAAGAEADRTSLYASLGTYRGPDGLPDAAEFDNTDFFGGLTNMLAVRDNLRQTALDYVQVRRLVANPALDLAAVAAQYPGATPRLDGARVGYLGNSLGGIIGTVFAAVDPDVNPVVLNVPGGGLISALAADSPAIGSSLDAAGSLVFGYRGGAPLTRFHPLTSLLQPLVDGGDPSCFASEVTRPAEGRGHDVWVTLVEADAVVPNRANELLVRALGIPQITGALRSVAGLETVSNPLRSNVMGRTQVMHLQSPAAHGSNLSQRYGTLTWRTPFPRDEPGSSARFVDGAAVRVRNPLLAFHRALARFFTSAWEGAAVVDVTGIDSYRDYDDDLWTDEEERAMGSDPFDPASRPAGDAPRRRDLGF